MIKKVQIVLILIMICLAGFLAYDVYGDGILEEGQTIKNKFESQIPESDTEPLTVQTETETETESETETETESETEAVLLPEYFDLREQGKAPVVKDQGNLETCWAVAASSALESDILPDEHLIFSADHLSLQNPYLKGQEEGGAYVMTMAYLASWMGPVLEEDDPYGDGVTTEGLEPVRHIQEMQVIVEKDYDAVKTMVYKHGAVQSSFYMDMQNAQYSSVYYNEFDYAYCYNGEEEPNHDVLIIGWDDHYPKENFTAEVKNNGAFICQNSWGETFGDGGIFYVSYEDVLVGGYCIGYTGIESADNYDNIYQSDLCGWVGQLGYEKDSCYFANVYESQTDELAEAVGFYAVGKDTKYTIYKTEKFTRGLSLLSKEKIQSGKLKNPGYYTIPLKETIALEVGKKFALIIEIETPGEEFPVAAEYQADENTAMVVIDDGEGYISHNGIIWDRAETKYSCNVCLKVYTSNSQKVLEN